MIRIHIGVTSGNVFSRSVILHQYVSQSCPVRLLQADVTEHTVCQTFLLTIFISHFALILCLSVSILLFYGINKTSRHLWPDKMLLQWEIDTLICTPVKFRPLLSLHFKKIGQAGQWFINVCCVKLRSNLVIGSGVVKILQVQEQGGFTLYWPNRSLISVEFNALWKKGRTLSQSEAGKDN
jgi:hypothetical protein